MFFLLCLFFSQFWNPRKCKMNNLQTWQVLQHCLIALPGRSTVQCGKSAVQHGKLCSDVFRCIPETQSVTDMTTFWLFFITRLSSLWRAVWAACATSRYSSKRHVIVPYFCWNIFFFLPPLCVCSEESLLFFLELMWYDLMQNVECVAS